MAHETPHFVIVGAPKSGTTSLFEYLIQHPSIFMPGAKETVFFCGYEKNFRGPGSHAFNEILVTDEEEYLSLFSGTPEGVLTGEASTDYLSCPRAAFRLKEWNPKARIVICLRNPIHRAYSEHMSLARDMLEEEEFSVALRLESERRAMGWQPLFRHVERSLYYRAVKRYIETFGKDNVKIVFYEELAQSPKRVTESLFEFLGLAPIPVDTSRSHNTSGFPRSKALQNFAFGKSAFHGSRIAGVARKLIKQSTRARISEAIVSANMEKKGMRQEDFHGLRGIFKDDILALQELLGVDLSGWLEGRG